MTTATEPRDYAAIIARLGGTPRRVELPGGRPAAELRRVAFALRIQPTGTVVNGWTLTERLSGGEYAIWTRSTDGGIGRRVDSTSLARRLYHTRVLLPTQRVHVLRLTDEVTAAMCAELNGGVVCPACKGASNALSPWRRVGGIHSDYESRNRGVEMYQCRRCAAPAEVSVSYPRPLPDACPRCGEGSPCRKCNGNRYVAGTRGLLLPTGQRVVVEPAQCLALATVEYCGPTAPTGRVPLTSLCTEAQL